MNAIDTCFICRRSDSDAILSAWFVRDRRLVVHLECWLAWYEQRTRSGKAPRRRARFPGQDDSEQAS